jgi:hypothetical protein
VGILLHPHKSHVKWRWDDDIPTTNSFSRCSVRPKAWRWDKGRRRRKVESTLFGGERRYAMGVRVDEWRKVDVIEEKVGLTTGRRKILLIYLLMHQCTRNGRIIR